MATHSTANAAQQEYWNALAGPRWVGLEGFVERRVRGSQRSAVEPLGGCRRRAGARNRLRHWRVHCAIGRGGRRTRASGRRRRHLRCDAGRRTQADRRKRTAQRLANAGRRADPQIRARPFRPDRLALWRHVLRDSGGGIHQFASRGAPRRPAVFCLLETPYGQPSLADPLRSGLAPSGAARAQAPQRPRTDGVRRPRSCALVARRGRVRGHRDPPRGPGHLHLVAARGGRARLHHGPLRSADR